MFLAVVSLVPHLMRTVRRGQGCVLLDGKLALFHACFLVCDSAGQSQTRPSASTL